MIRPIFEANENTSRSITLYHNETLVGNGVILQNTGSDDITAYINGNTYQFLKKGEATNA